MNAATDIQAPTGCHLCGSVVLRVVPGYSRLSRVTSDCKPWPSGGHLAVCDDCHLVQTVVSDSWRAEVDRIYRQYTIYHQSGGAEQSVFSADDGRAALRSDRIVQVLTSRCDLPDRGALLDLGCGNGAFLRAASRVLADWQLSGTEFDDKHRADVEAIPGFERLYVGDLDGIKERFDLVSMIHVLEHIASPQKVLGNVHRLLKPGGFLLIEVPDCLVNSFMLLVADHCSHFSVQGLSEIVAASGFELVHSTDSWVSKEVTVVARRTVEPSKWRRPNVPSDESRRIVAGVDWLTRLLESARAATQTKHFGIFGTSIAATWLDAELNQCASFFVDEDPGRIGKQHQDRPILPPSRVPPGASVFVALPPAQAAAVASRIGRADFTFVLPP